MDEKQEIPITKEQLKSGMKLWDSEKCEWQKILRVYLWEEIIKEHPNRFYKNRKIQC